MNYSLCFHISHQNVLVALCNNKEIIDCLQIPSQASSATLITSIQHILKSHNLTLHNCTYLASNQGPAPFTALRTILATINGIHCATQVPLIGIDVLKGMLTQYASEKYPYTIALLNAFNNELYYAIASQKECITGYGSINDVIEVIDNRTNQQQALIIGNGISLLKNSADYQEKANFIFESSVQECSIADIAHLAWAAWNNQTLQETLIPLYLKKHAAERALSEVR